MPDPYKSPSTNLTTSTNPKELSGKENKSQTDVEILHLIDTVNILDKVINLLEDKLYNVLVSDKMEEAMEAFIEADSPEMITLASDIKSIRRTLNENITRLERLTARLEN